MISHNSLAERLNAVKTGDPIPESPVKTEASISKHQLYPSGPQIISYKQFFISEGYKLFNVMSASILYGFGLKSLFSTDWSFIGVLGVGFLLNHTVTILLKLFKK